MEKAENNNGVLSKKKKIGKEKNSVQSSSYHKRALLDPGAERGLSPDP